MDPIASSNPESGFSRSAAAHPEAASLGRDIRPMRVTAQSPGGALSVRRSSFELNASATGPHILTVALEDYYHVGAFNRVIQRGQWYRFERRIEASTMRTLDLLDEFQSRATFFVLGWVADTMPELIRVVAERGHEIASKGYYHRNIRQLTPAEFRDDLARAREALERAGGHRIIGYRVADDWFQPADLWALDVLADEGYEYDSSVGPILRSYASEPWRRFAHLHRYDDRTLWELPISTADVFGFLVPIAGGNYFRQFPHGWSGAPSRSGRGRIPRPTSCTSTRGSSTPISPRSTRPRGSHASGNTGTSTGCRSSCGTT